MDPCGPGCVAWRWARGRLTMSRGSPFARRNRGPFPGVHRGRFAPERRLTIAGVRPSPRHPAGSVAAVSRAWVPGVVLASLVLAAGGLIVAEFLTFAEVRVITAVPPGGTRTGGAHHGYALAVIGVAMLPLAFGALRAGSRPAAIGLVVLSAAALAIVVAVDWRATDDSGALAQVYELARAHAREGLWLELGAACGALVASAATLALVPRTARASSRQSIRRTSLPRT